MADRARSSKKEQPKSNGPRTGFDATLILMTGFFAVLGGLALCFGPMVSWKLRQIAEGFAYLGLFGGTFFMGGLILVALGTLRRTQDTLRREAWQSRSDDTQDVELGEDVQAIGAMVEQMATEFSAVRATFQPTIENSLRPLKEQVTNLTNLANQPESQGGDDAVFRMAASLDQLGARLESQFTQRTGELESRIETLQAVHDAAIAAIKNLSDSFEEARAEASESRSETLARLEEFASMPAAQAPAPQVDPEPETFTATESNFEPEAAPEPTPEPAEDPLSTAESSELAEPAAATEDFAAPLPTPSAHPGLSLGLGGDTPAFGAPSRTQAAHDAFVEGDGQTDDADPALPSTPLAMDGMNELAGSLEGLADDEAPSAAQESSLRDALERMRRECEPD